MYVDRQREREKKIEHLKLHVSFSCNTHARIKAFKMNLIASSVAEDESYTISLYQLIQDI